MAVWIKTQQTSSKWGSPSSQNTFLRLKHPLHVFASDWIIQILKAQDSTWARYSGCSSCCKSSLQLVCATTCYRELTFWNEKFNCDSTWLSMILSEGRLQPAVLILSMVGCLGALAWKPPKPHVHTDIPWKDPGCWHAAIAPHYIDHNDIIAALFTSASLLLPLTLPHFSLDLQVFWGTTSPHSQILNQSF